MNWKRGIVRLAAVGLVPWLVYWGVEYNQASAQVADYEQAVNVRLVTMDQALANGLAELPKDVAEQVVRSSNASDLAARDQALESLPSERLRSDQAMRMLTYYPMAALALLLALAFVLRGFWPGASKSLQPEA